MGENTTTDTKHKLVAKAASRILDAYGHIETSDSSRVVYTDGDLNIAREADILEIIYRGTLVFRHGSDCSAGDCVFEEHGDWVRLIERLEKSGPDSPDEVP
ncbi:MAG: hypothetical protein QOH25_2703 [Acidobacteriota bacterium]|jgi:hypothetical protein|nr:hypothetical protein [Acidobacteriota bacterium]